MNCKKCGALMTSEDQFCKNCGTAVSTTGGVVGNGQQQMGGQVMNSQSSPIQSNVSMNGAYNGQGNWNMGGQAGNNMQVTPNNGGNKNVLVGVGIVLVIAVMAVVIFLGKSMLDGNSSNGGSGSSMPATTLSGSAYKVNMGGFTFSIPDNYVYEAEAGALNIGDSAGTWVVEIGVASGNYSQVKANRSQLRGAVQQSGYSATDAKVQTLGGVEFITLELQMSGMNVIMAYAELNSMYTAAIAAYNLDNEFDYSLLENIAPTISSASYVGESTNIEGNSKIDMDVVMSAIDSE